MTIGMVIASLLTAASAGAEGQTLPASRIEATVEQALRARLPAGTVDAQVRVVGRVAEQALPAGVVALEVGQISGRWPRARVAVPVRINVEGRANKTLMVWAEVTAPRVVPTYASQQDLHVDGASVQLVSATVDMTCCAGETIDPSRTSGLRLRRAVRAGMPAMRADFEAMPDITARAPVRIVVAQGAMRITTAGIALADGRVGDRIPVRATTSQAALQARVVAPGEVMIDE